MGANDLVPPHYKSSYLHWDFAIRIGLNYLEACTTKYVTRWKKKGGLEDLKKAMHYLDKLMEVETAGENVRLRRDNVVVDIEVGRFVTANGLDQRENQYIFILCAYKDVAALKNARQILTKITTTAQRPLIPEQNKPGTPEDGSHHAKQEE